MLPNYQIEEKSDKKIIIEKKYLPIKVNKTFFSFKNMQLWKKTDSNKNRREGK